MCKLLGVVFLMAGASGYSFCICKELNTRLELLREIKYMYELIQNEIRYTALPLPEIFHSVAKKVADPFADMLERIREKMDWEKGEVLSTVWQEEVRKRLTAMPLAGKQKEALLRFSESLGLLESQGQAKALERRIAELERWIEELTREIKNKNKVIMSLGISAGVLLSILLL